MCSTAVFELKFVICAGGANFINAEWHVMQSVLKIYRCKEMKLLSLVRNLLRGQTMHV